METDKICRTCLKNGVKLRSIFSKNKKQCKYADMLDFCVSLKVTEGDNLPQEICNKCVYNLSAFYQFRVACLKSNEILQNSLKNNDKILPYDKTEIPEKRDESPEITVKGENPAASATTVKTANSSKSQCEICGKFLSCHSNLVQHMRKHTGILVTLHC